ncbi:MAG: hypothetical protein ACO1N7_04820 [Sphingobacteriaceae bacterium]
MEIFNLELERLLKGKPFIDLTGSDKEYILKHISEEEYTRYHLILKATIETYGTTSPLKPKASIEKNLKKAFNAKYKKPLFNLDLLQFKLPQLSTAKMILASTCLLFMAYFIFISLPSPKVIVQVKSIKKHEEQNKTYHPNIVSIEEKQPVTIRKERAEKSINHQQKNTKIKRKDENTVSNNDTTLLCLTIDAEPIGLNVNPEDYEPGLTANIPPSFNNLNRD